MTLNMQSQVLQCISKQTHADYISKQTQNVQQLHNILLHPELNFMTQAGSEIEPCSAIFISSSRVI